MFHTHRIRVRYGETDQMGVVHHSVYALYFEEARTSLMREIGACYADLEREGFLLPLTGMGLRFFRGPRYDDVLAIRCRISEFSRVRVRIDYRVYRDGDMTLLSEGYTEHGSVGRDFRPRRLPEDVAAKFAAALAAGPWE